MWSASASYGVNGSDKLEQMFTWWLKESLKSADVIPFPREWKCVSYLGESLELGLGMLIIVKRATWLAFGILIS